VVAAEDGGDEGDGAEGAATLFDWRGCKDQLPSVRRRRGSQADSTPERSGTDELDSGDLTASCRGN
jgi:hypothetical protein